MFPSAQWAWGVALFSRVNWQYYASVVVGGQYRILPLRRCSFFLSGTMMAASHLLTLTHSSTWPPSAASASSATSISILHRSAKCLMTGDPSSACLWVTNEVIHCLEENPREFLVGCSTFRFHTCQTLIPGYVAICKFVPCRATAWCCFGMQCILRMVAGALVTGKKATCFYCMWVSSCITSIGSHNFLCFFIHCFR